TCPMHSNASHLEWPFFNDHHRQLVHQLEAWCVQQNLAALSDADVYAACAELVRRMGQAGWLTYAVPSGVDGQLGGRFAALESRSLCLIRETLARHHALADFAFAMQGLGSGAITLFGSDAQKAAYLPRVAAGEAIAAFALSEPEAGSDAAALQCAARRDGESWIL